MVTQNPGGVVLSTDEYFIQNGQYQFEPNLLGEAHEWNHQRGEYYKPVCLSQSKMSGVYIQFPSLLFATHWLVTRQSNLKAHVCTFVEIIFVVCLFIINTDLLMEKKEYSTHFCQGVCQLDATAKSFQTTPK